MPDRLETPPHGTLALVLSGGGARGAYQAGVLRGLARLFPDVRFPVIVGTSAGAINAAFLAAHPGTLREATHSLGELWGNLETEGVFHADTGSLTRNFLRWIRRLASGDSPESPEVRGLVDTRPLHDTMQRVVACVDGELIGIEHNLERGLIQALALTTLNYSTGQTVTWIQGEDPRPWREPQHQSVRTRITVEHVMASASLPLFFPAVRLGDAWYGDGGIRLSTPLAPALRLGADRILAISPRYRPSLEEADRHQIAGYPPPAQILSHLLSSVFLDVLDQDVQRLLDTNTLVSKLPSGEREGFRPVSIRVVRPSQDLAKLATDYESRLPKAFRYLTRSLGTRETTTPDFLSFLMFQPEYLQRLIEIGEADAERRSEEIRELLASEVDPQRDDDSLAQDARAAG
ncbi:MAG TPA: patatin-like phospholipase family protein [Thermoanaerobaculia bacterium]|nr:patatin-like phospholipase family protein [Thermoanaerobaculia bacterium]